MTGRELSARRPSRFGLAAVALVGLCVLACLVPVLSGLVAGTVLDRVLDAPLWLTALAAGSLTVAAFMLFRHRSGTRHG